MAYAVFTDDNWKAFDEHDLAELFTISTHHGIHFERREIFYNATALLQYNCPDIACEVMCTARSTLHRHVRLQHRQLLCKFCMREKIKFVHELHLFTLAELLIHMCTTHGQDRESLREPTARLCAGLQQQALARARYVSIFEQISYPDDISPPDPTVYHPTFYGDDAYDQAFLLQFRDAFLDRPSGDWDQEILASLRGARNSR